MPGDSIADVTRTRVTTAAAIRDLTGYTKATDVSDVVIESLIDRAQAFVIHEVAERVHALALYGNRDGSNTRFQLPRERRGQVILDADGDGTEVSDCQVWLRTDDSPNPPTYASATVASIDEVHGIITLDSAPASSVDRVEFTGYVLPAPISKDRFAAVVDLYVAHLVDRRVRGPGAVALSNPNHQSRDGDQDGQNAAGSGWFGLYRREVLRLVDRPARVASRRLSLPDGRVDRLTERGGDGPVGSWW